MLGLDVEIENPPLQQQYHGASLARLVMLDGFTRL